MEKALTRQLTTVVAAAGFGKTTLLQSWSAGVNSASYALTRDDRALNTAAGHILETLRLRVPGLPSELDAALGACRCSDCNDVERARAIAALMCAELDRQLTDHLVLVLDDLHMLGDASGSIRLIEVLCQRATPFLHVVLASREDLAISTDELCAQGEVLELTGSDLAFTEEEAAALLSAVVGLKAVELGDELHEATGGWPVAVGAAMEQLQGRPGQVSAESFRRAEAPMFDYLAREVFERDLSPVRELARTTAAFECFTTELCETLGVTDAARSIASLARQGLLLPSAAGTGKGRWWRWLPPARRFALERMPVDERELHQIHEGAAAWFGANGRPEEAIRSLAAIGEPARIAGLLSEQGQALLARGAVDTIICALELVGSDLRDMGLWQLAGEALQIKGDWDRALACFEHAGMHAEPRSAAMARCIGSTHYLRGDAGEALKAFGQARVDGSDPGEEAVLLAWAAIAHRVCGEAEDAGRLLTRAVAIATAHKDASVVATVHAACAVVAAMEGDRAASASSSVRALEHAEREGNVVLTIWIRTSRAHHLVEEGSYVQALAELETVLPLAESTGCTVFHADGLHARGEACLRLGRLDEAIADLEGAKALYQRIGSHRVCHPLGTLGEAYRDRGDPALARAAYEEAIRYATRSGVHALVPALAGLARLVATEEPEEATRLVARAVTYGPGPGFVAALLASGRVALALGDRNHALGAATQAAAEARRRRDRAGIAESLELQGLCSTDAHWARGRLQEAVAIWREIGNPLGEARAELEIARSMSPSDGLVLTQRAERTARAAGALSYARAAAQLGAELEQAERPLLAIRTLGGFQVVRDGKPVPATAWQSRKARDLVKILVSRRGRPIPREVLMETLWPEEDPDKLANRLSVALSTARAVLDPDKRLCPDDLIAADQATVRLAIERLAIDVEAFLAESAAGLSLWRQGRAGEAAEQLAQADAAYGGDFLEEDLYEDWASALRDEARAMHIHVARTLAEHAGRCGDHDTAVRYQLRILERDPYDEKAHLQLVETLNRIGSHGEARRHYRAYATRMAEIGVEAAAFPGLERSVDRADRA